MKQALPLRPFTLRHKVDRSQVFHHRPSKPKRSNTSGGNRYDSTTFAELIHEKLYCLETTLEVIVIFISVYKILGTYKDNNVGLAIVFPKVYVLYHEQIVYTSTTKSLFV